MNQKNTNAIVFVIISLASGVMAGEIFATINYFVVAATKKRGIVVRSASELDEFNRILSNQKLVELARNMDQVNPKQKETTSIGSPDIFEI